jgi:hypothetical protein
LARILHRKKYYKECVTLKSDSAKAAIAMDPNIAINFLLVDPFTVTLALRFMDLGRGASRVTKDGAPIFL